MAFATAVLKYWVLGASGKLEPEGSKISKCEVLIVSELPIVVMFWGICLIFGYLDPRVEVGK